ncbi:FIVAR domain-containing protein [Gardnerella sp. DNF00354]|uniref:peptidase n=1 Tax=Gardnerella sp. DNF00354 TaxID=2749046 RepID=UPI003BAF5AB1
MTTKSGKHANKTSGSAKDKAAKVVDMRKVAALSAGAAGVIAGAAIAFGATPAMAADATSASVKTNDPAKEQNLVDANKGNSKTSDDSKATKKNEASKDETTNSEVKKEAKKEESKEAKEEPKKEQTKPAEQAVAKTDGNTDVTKTEAGSKVESIASVDNQDAKQDSEETGTPAGSVVNKRTRRSLDEKKQPEPTKDAQAENQDRAEGDSASQDPNKIKPDTTDTTNTKINIDENNAGTMLNMYGWGSSDNTYSVNGETHTVTFNFSKPKDGGTITAIAIFPAQNNGLTNDKSKRGAEYYSGDPKMHQSFSGNYTFKPNGDGSATLTMSDLFRDGNLNGGAEAYAANRSIFVYVTKDGTTTIYKTNAFRAATLVPPKASGSVVLKYNQPLTKEQIQAAITAAANAETTRKDKKSVNDQIVAASKSNGVNTTVNGKLTQVADTLTDKINEKSADAYDAKQFAAINKETSAKDAKNKTYVAGAKTLNTYMVTDLGFKSQAIPLTVARYDDRIDKPIVEDPTKVSAEVKEDIKKKLAKINGVSTDKITFDNDGNAVIHFDGVDAADAPKIKLSDLVLKKLEEKDISVPAADKATVIYNPLAYSDAEIKSIKKAIYEANKDKTELGLSATDYEKQISLSYLTGNLTATGDSNKGISNGQAENIITVKIKTDKAVAEFTSDVKAHKLTRLADIRKDYNVSWKQNKIDGRDSDEGLSWSEDGKTIIYRYDPTAAKEFDTNKILDLLKATPKDPNSGLRDLTGNEKLDHEGVDGKGKKSHVGYVIDKNDQPTTELSLGNMDGAYWKYSRNVDNSGVDLGNEESNAGSYSWDKDAKPVVVAAKQDKVYKARLFVLPYGLTMYRNVYMENGNQPWNTPKAINVIFVPQTNHKIKDLKKSVGEHATTQVDGKDVPTQHEYYNASDDKKAAYDDALKKANDALKEAGDTEDSKLSEELKARIDNATIRLDKAREALDGAKTDKSKLEQDIKDQGNPKKDNTAASGTYETDKYKNVTEPSFLKDDGKTPDTKKNEAASAAKTAYDEALAAAEKVNKDANATQKAVDDAKAKLDAARKELDKYSTNKDKLNAAIAEHGQVKTGDASKQGDEKLKTADPAYQNANDDERKAYDDAVKKANELSKNPNASQKEVNEAITALETAKKALDAKATNKTKLAVAVQQTFDNPDPNDATKQSTFYKNALGKQTNGSEEEKAKAAAAIKAYDDALKEAKKLLLEDKDGKATQAQVDAAVKALNDAEDKLHDGYSTNKNDLTKALADNIDGYLKPAYFNAFDKSFGAGADAEAAKKAFKEYNDAYHAAKALKAKFANTDPAQQPTDEDCKKAKEALEKARQVIDTYATDTKKLSAAFWNDLAIQNSPAYKNAKALAVKTNPTKDEKAQVEAAKKIKQAYDDAVAKLHKAFSNTLDQDKDAHGNPFTKIPDAKGNPTSKNYLDGVQAHANGEPLDRDVTKILTAMNDAADQLKQFATKTDKLQESINKDTDTQKDPAYKNARDPHKLGTDGKEDTSGYDAIKEKAKAYDDALKDAKALMIKPDATQEDVNAALKKLDDARKALNDYKTNVDELKKNVEAQGSTDGPAVKEGTVTSDAYRNASDPHFMKEEGGKLVPDKDRNTNAAAAKKAYDEALTKAQELLKKHGDKDTPQDAKPTQKEIDAALTTLNEKRQALDAYKTDTTKLDEEAKKSTADGATVVDADFEAKPEFKNAKAKTSNGVENTDVTAYKKALKDARGLLAKKDSATPSERPTQQQINDALEALKNAKKQITDNYKTNLEPLTSAKDFADGDFKKTPEYQNAVAKKGAGDQGATAALGTDGGDTGFDNVLNQIKQKLNDDNWKKTATQKSVNNLLKKLQEAQDKIAKDYKTDAKLLENEVGDKDAQGNDVIPPFEASVPYKNALAKADTEEDKTSDTSATKKLEDYNKKLKAAQDLINKVNNPDPNAKPEDRPTQAQVDAALKALQDAKKAIDDSFGTKIDDLKTEAAKSTADTPDPTAKPTPGSFESTTEYQNALAKKAEDGKSDNADVTAYKEALKKARALLEKFDANGKPKPGEKDIPSQKEVDEALKNLKEIKDKITKNYVTSPHDLQQEVDKSKDGDTDTSTDVFENTPEFKNAQAKGDEASKKALEDYNTKLKAAKDLLAAFDRATGKPVKPLPTGMDKAPTQQELDAALKELQDAKKKITDGYKTDSSKLKSEADANDTFTKTPEYQNAQAKGDDASKQALEAYKKALEDANKVLGDKNATQAQVDAALKKLQDAKSKLSDGYKTDKSDLTAEAGKDSDFTKTPEYQNAAGSPEAEAYKRALDEANRILGDKNATQADVDAALKKLQDAKSKLVDSHKTDKSDLNTEAGNDPDFRKSIPFIIGKAADLAEYQQALNDADSVLKDPNATQAQVDQALRRLRDAKQKLIDSYNRLINSGSGVGSGSDHDFGTDTDVNTGVGVNDVNNTSVNNVADKGALQAEVDAALGDVSANANGVVADSNLVSEFNAALDYARSVLADANATQGQVDSALARLRAARAALRAGMLAARNSAGMNLKRGDVSGVNTGASSSVFAALAAVFAGLGVAGAASKRRRHSAR